MESLLEGNYNESINSIKYRSTTAMWFHSLSFDIDDYHHSNKFVQTRCPSKVAINRKETSMNNIFE